MTKKSFLTVVFAVALVFVFVGCGSDKKNKEEAEKPDTGDTEAVTDTDPAEAGDTEAAPDTDPTDTEFAPDEDNTGVETGDEEMQPDIDWNELPDDGSCTIKSSFGTHSVKKDISDICIQEIANANSGICSWNRHDKNETSKYITYLQKLKLTFADECKDKEDGQIVECPDFIPETLKLESLSGCDVYNVNPYSSCSAPCPDLYFLTNNALFHTVFVSEVDSYPSPFIYVKSSDSIKEASFIAGMNVGSNDAVFTWSEKTEDGTEIEKEVWLKMRVVDPVTGEGEEEEVPDEDIILAQCEDSEGRIYKEGDLISDGCGALICSEEGFVLYEAYGGMSCYDGCDPESPTSMKYWFCPDGSDLQWCICEEDAEHGSKTNCVDRIDLQCPQE